MNRNQHGEQLKQWFLAQLISGNSYARITDARAEAEDILGEPILPGSPSTKLVDEAMEAAIVRTACLLIEQSETTHQAYDRLVNLLERQPNLAVRSSTSVLQQAYSTPIPIAYLASTLAGITEETTVYEPTAGNGALLITANPARVIANEINEERFGELTTRGYPQLTQNDALTYQPQKQVDRVICNPPFGSVLDGNQRPKRFLLQDTWTTQIDHIIALNALEAMKADGQAVLILGGKLGTDEAQRSERYNSRESRAFYYLLYQHYNVTQHLSIWGDLYRKQGAGFPIDLIVIAGRGSSQRTLPAADVPVLYRSFSDLKELLPNELIPKLSSDLGTSHDALTLRRQGASLYPNPRRVNVPSPNAGTSGLDDPSLDAADPQQPNRDPTAPRQEPNPTSASPAGSLIRDGGGHSVDPMAGGVVRNADSLQRTIHRSPLDIRDERDDVSSPAHQRGASGIPRTPGSASGDSSRGMVDHAHPISSQVTDMSVIEISESESIQNTLDTQPRQVSYFSRSKGPSTATLIPYNMASAAQSALDRFEQRYGDIDEYLSRHLGYASVTELHRYLSAEQVDSAALAISNLEQGNGFITGDQTGVGKGRICASIMRYAQQQGKVAIFVTQKNTLYADMMRDVSDIGIHRFTPFVTDIKARIPLGNGGELSTGGAAAQEQIMLEMMHSRSAGGYSAVFTTYSQLQTIGKQEPLRRNFLRAIAPNAILILDEAHEAGGTKTGWKDRGPVDRAEFVRELVDLSVGVFYSSATYAKRPDVMDLYARRTDLRLGVSSMSSLEHILNRGGVPLQQIVASKFVASGQMLRRERSYEGIRFQAQVVPVEREVADQFSAAMRAIKDFDKAKQEAIKDLSRQLKAEAKALGMDSAIGEVGAKSTNFTSLMHNCIEQGLLAQKAEATVQAAIASLQANQKPVIALASTMGSFIESYAGLHDLKHGDAIDVSFSHLLERYLERSRDVLLRDYKGQTTRHRLTDAELGVNGLLAYEEALECIQTADLNVIPVSPIDYITQRLQQSGYSVREVTGRKAGLDYATDGSTTYKLRPDAERTARAKIGAVAQFNSGDAEVIILNCSGSTGISLHASEKFADQRPRHMIVAQAERDINIFMQMLGRVHRTGQVALPSYTLLMGDLPAEKRPGAILCRKMASLNANTTAARETDISLSSVVDFMNPYGEQVVTELLNEDIELNAKLDFPTAQTDNDSTEIALIKRVTGRIPLLPIVEQEQVYSLIESEYQELMEQARAMGESILEADQLDLDARTVARMEVIADDSGIQSEFTGPVYLEVVDAKSAAKPLTQLEAVNIVRNELELSPLENLAEHNRNSTLVLSQQKTANTVTSLTDATETYRQTVIEHKHDENSIAKFNERLNRQFGQVKRTLETYPPSTSVRVVTPTSKNILYGIVAAIEPKSRSSNPAAPNGWKIRILVADSAKQIVLPLSKFNSGREGSAVVEVQERDWFGNEVYGLFDQRQQTGRITYQIFTGNLITAFEKYPNGKLVNYTDHQSQVRQGLIMPKGFDIEESLQQEPVAFNDIQQVKAFLTELTERRGAVKTLDELLIVRAQLRGEGFLLQAPRARDSGGQYYLDEAIIAAVGSDFYSVSDRMEVVVPPERFEQTLSVIMQQRQYNLAAFDDKDIARDYLGIKLPELEVLEPGRVETLRQPIAEILPQPDEPAPEAIALQSILPAPQQRGLLEKRVARFLDEAEIREAVTAEFHLRIENEPYIPLVIERHDDELFLTHYLEQNGDTFIDTEMVFRIDQHGQLQFKETAVQDPFRGGEHRAADRIFAQVFARNIQEQGFAEVAKAQAAQAQNETNQGIVDQSFLHSSLQRYLENKAQYSNAVVLIRAGDFYESFMEDAQTITEKLELVQTSLDSGSPSMSRVPLAGFPVRALERFTQQLTQEFTVVVVEQDAIVVHSRQAIAQTDLEQQTESLSSLGTTAEVEELNLFDVNQFTSPSSGHALDVIGYDPTWSDAIRQSASQVQSPSQSSQISQPPNLQELSEQVREMDLRMVAASLGLEQDRYDEHKWQGAGHIISISGSKFMDWSMDKGGGGAIDLVMHVQAVGFREAVQWLSGQSFTAPSFRPIQSSNQQSEPPVLEMPIPNVNRWPAVRDYLVTTRHLPALLIDRLHERGLIYADSMQNAVFVRHVTSSNRAIWRRGDVTGASLRGTWGENNVFHGLATGSSRPEGWFWIGAGQGEVKRVMLSESPIDALSLATLDKQRRGAEGVSIYLSTDGSGAIPTAALQQVLEQGGQVGVAFDADSDGESMAWHIAQELPGVGRITPAYGKDWNERLIYDGQSEQATQPERDKQTLDALWQWHRVAQQLGRSPNYLSRITEVAREVVKGASLPERAQAVMESDLKGFTEKQKANSRLRILESMQGKSQKSSVEIDS